MRLVTRPERIASSRSTLPTARAPPEALIDEPETFELFLERGGKNAERFRRPLLISVRGHHHGDDEIALEAQEHVPQNQPLSARGLESRRRVEQGWIREITRHWTEDRRGAFPRQWMRASLRMNLGKADVRKLRLRSGTALAPQTNGMARVLSVERFEARKRASNRAFNSAVKCACTLQGPRMLVAIDSAARAFARARPNRPLRPLPGRS